MAFLGDRLYPREAVCLYAGWDIDEAINHRVKYGKTATVVYELDSGDFICCTNEDERPNTRKQFNDALWKHADGYEAEYVKSQGRTIWIITNAKSTSAKRKKA